MKTRNLHQILFGLIIASVQSIIPASAQDSVTGLIGKNSWLFYKLEMSTATDTVATNTSLALIQKFNKVLSANGIELLVALVPVKMRVYADQLPDDIKLNDYLKGNYDRMQQHLRSNQVNVVDINTAFLSSPMRGSDTPLYFRLDTHWTPTGAMLAAETIKSTMDTIPGLKRVLDTIPEEKYKITISNRKRPSRGRDLIPNLPPNSPTFAPELLAQVNIDRITPQKEDLLGRRQEMGLALLGSSYSINWTGFADALRYVLQRDLLSLVAPADQGSWVGMETFLRDDAFQTQAPKILIWEMPERDMRAPPDYKFRPARYISDNNEWLLRASALVQTQCKPSLSKAKIAPLGLAATPAVIKGSGIATGPTNEADFIELNFDNPIEKLDYLSARLISSGSKTVTLEATGPGVSAKRFTLTVAGDDIAHAFKTPIPSVGRGFNKVRIYPGKTNNFTFENTQVCRQPEDLLN